jgi:hypothetical protein
VKVSFGTRLDSGLRQRLKVYAASKDQTIEAVVEAALNGYLPQDATAEEALSPVSKRGPGAVTPEPQGIGRFQSQKECR